jgi:hypothetical protein
VTYLAATITLEIGFHVIVRCRIRPHHHVDIFVPREEYHLLMEFEVELDNVAHFREIVNREVRLVVILIMTEWILLVELASDHY